MRPSLPTAFAALAFAALALALVVPTRAFAQGTPAMGGVGASTNLDVQNYWPTAGPADAFTLRSSSISPSGVPGFALALNFMRQPLRLADSMGNTYSAVDYALTSDFLFSLGLFNFLQISAAFPLVLAQEGDGNTPIVGSTGSSLGDTAMRDIRVDVAIALVQRERSLDARGFGLRLDLGFAIPFGDDTGFEGAGTFTFAPMVVADYRLGVVQFTANVGARVRGQALVGNTVWGSQMVLGAGVSVRPSGRSPLSVSAEALVLPPLASQSGYVSFTPAEGFVGLRYALDRAHDVDVFGGVGLPLDQAPTVPAWRGIVGLNYAPRGNDTDHDGVPDADDRCPDQPEDRDGFEDDDGCPDPNNNHDGIPDVTDHCPNAPEDHDGFQDDDGCPDPNNDQDGILNVEDECPNVPAGDHPDPQRRGCPIADTDHDGVLDDIDQCVDVPAGEHPDPARPGCPLPDRDRDGVTDNVDQCPDVPAGEHPDPLRPGCPDRDRDHDGVLDPADRCPDQPETINGIDDDDGCPDEGPENVVWVAQDLHFVRPLVIAVGPRVQRLPAPTESLLAQAAQRIRGRGAAVTHVYILVTPGPGAPAVANAASVHRGHLVADVLIAHGIPESLVTVAVPGSLAPAVPVAPRPAAVTTPRGRGPAPLPRVAPGTVHLWVETIHGPPAR